MKRGRLMAGVAVVGAVAAGGVGGAIVGVPGLSGAQQFPRSVAVSPVAASGSTIPGKPARTAPLLDAAAKALGLTTPQLRDELSDGKTTIADVARRRGVDVNKVIDAMASADRARIGDIVNRPWPGPDAFGPGRGGRGPGGRMFEPGLSTGMGRAGHVALDAVAKALGITTDELKTDLRNGQSIADIAKAKHVDVQKVVDALVADASARIDQQVKDGHLTQAQADRIKAGLKTMIGGLVNTGLPKLPAFGGRFGRHGFGFGGPGPFGPDQPSTPSTPSTPTTAKPPAA